MQSDDGRERRRWMVMMLLKKCLQKDICLFECVMMLWSSFDNIVVIIIIAKITT